MCDVLWSVTRNTINDINHTAKHLTIHKTHRYRNIMLIIFQYNANYLVGALGLRMNGAIKPRTVCAHTHL